MGRLARGGVRIVKVGPHSMLIERASLEAWIAKQELPPAPAERPKRQGRKPGGWWQRIRKRRARDM